MNLKFYKPILLLFFLGALFTPKNSLAQTTWYTDPGKSTSGKADSIYFPNLNSADYSVVNCAFCSTSPGGPFSVQTISSTDNLVIQSATWLNVGGSAFTPVIPMPCNNITLNGTLNKPTGSAYLAFNGLFSGTGILRTSGAIGNNSDNSTLNFQSATPGDNTYGGLNLYNNITLVGNTDMGTPATSTTYSGGSIAFRVNGIKLFMNAFNLSLSSLSASSYKGYISGNPNSNLTIRAGYSSSSPTANLAGAQLYFDQTTPGTTNIINSITSSGSTKIYTPVIVYGYLNNLYNGSGATKFTLNEPDNTLGTSGLVTLASTASGTAYITSTGGGLYYDNLSNAGTFPIFNIQQYLSAKRGWRLLGNPGNNTISLSAFASNSNIDLNNGTNTGSNNAPTVYSYDGTQTGDPWVANTSGNWAAYNGLLLFVRGTSGQGVGGGTYTPSNVTLNANSSVLNQGTQSANSLSYNAGNSNTNWNLIANPYPAPVSVKALTGLYGVSGMNQSIYYFNPNKGGGSASTTNGDFDFITLTGSQDFNLPSFGAFFVQTQASGKTLQFTESAKIAGGGNTALFGGADDSLKIATIQLTDAAGNYIDKACVVADSKSSGTSTDHWDLPKLTIANNYMYLLSSDTKQLAIDARSGNSTDTISLGLELTTAQAYNFKVLAGNISNANQLYLRDKLLNTITPLTASTEYSFNVSTDGLNTISKRFDIILKSTKLGTTVNSDNTVSNIVSVSPNPATDYISIKLTAQSGSATTVISLLSMDGKVIKQITTEQNGGTITMPVTEISKGVYLVQVKNINGTSVTQIIKN